MIENVCVSVLVEIENNSRTESLTTVTLKAMLFSNKSNIDKD